MPNVLTVKRVRICPVVPWLDILLAVRACDQRAHLRLSRYAFEAAARREYRYLLVSCHCVFVVTFNTCLLPSLTLSIVGGFSCFCLKRQQILNFLAGAIMAYSYGFHGPGLSSSGKFSKTRSSKKLFLIIYQSADRQELQSIYICVNVLFVAATE